MKNICGQPFACWCQVLTLCNGPQATRTGFERSVWRKIQLLTKSQKSYTCLFAEEKPDVQALQIKEEPLASTSEELLASTTEHGAICSSKDIDCKLAVKQTVPGENAGTSSKSAVVKLSFQEENSREQNLLPGDGSFHFQHTDGLEARFPQYSKVKNESCAATADIDKIKTEQIERDLKFSANTEEELCIARLRAHVKAFSSTFFTEYEQETETTEEGKEKETISPQKVIGFSQGPFQCFWCPFEYFQREDQDRHMKRSHREEYTELLKENYSEHFNHLKNRNSSCSQNFERNSESQNLEHINDKKKEEQSIISGGLNVDKS
ncbi:hypothetical protein ElyMa_004994300 [Elysia marginata]|uniref:C2H2-type domain-containing protein n=1 Tax=Elysia marginata TaxID=1093978 RepID=A0AAV4J7D9_9GAST|nr:hypothetical protein ElyMa_004994300 [Elysia marginata]